MMKSRIALINANVFECDDNYKLPEQKSEYSNYLMLKRRIVAKSNPFDYIISTPELTPSEFGHLNTDCAKLEERTLSDWLTEDNMASLLEQC